MSLLRALGMSPPFAFNRVLCAPLLGVRGSVRPSIPFHLNVAHMKDWLLYARWLRYAPQFWCSIRHLLSTHSCKPNEGIDFSRLDITKLSSKCHPMSKSLRACVAAAPVGAQEELMLLRCSRPDLAITEAVTVSETSLWINECFLASKNTSLRATVFGPLIDADQAFCMLCKMCDLQITTESMVDKCADG